MAGFGEARVPHDILSDEDKWLKYFTKTQLLGIGIFAIIGFVLFRIFSFMGLSMVGLAMMLIMVLIGAAIMMVTIPVCNYLMGGGSYLWEVIVLLIYRKATQCTYVKNLTEDESWCN